MKKGIYGINGSCVSNQYDRIDLVNAISLGLEIEFFVTHPYNGNIGRQASTVMVRLHTLSKKGVKSDDDREKCSGCFVFTGNLLKENGELVTDEPEVAVRYCCKFTQEGGTLEIQ